ncbi:MAG: carboxylesterase family protein [Acidimicrobiales bacterium]
MRRRAPLAVLAMIVLVSVGCDLRLTPPPGTAPVRYRDAVFASVTTTSDVVYGTAVDQQGQTVSLTLDSYLPVGDSVTSRPAIVWVHGGSFSSGDKTSPELVDEATTFAKKGFVNVSINYRLSSGCSAATPTAACVTSIVDAKHDAQAAVRFLRAHAGSYGVDPTRIAVAGTSAGAITALNVGFDPTDPGTSGNPGFSSAAQAAVSLSGAAILTTPSPGDAPSLLFHGTSDVVVPYQWAVDTQTHAIAAGLVSELTSWSGAGHVPYAQHRTEILDQTTNFLFWTLNLTSAAH